MRLHWDLAIQRAVREFLIEERKQPVILHWA